MTYETLEKFLNFILEHNIDLTKEEKIFLKNTPKDIEYEDLLKWYKSNFRKNKQAQSLISKTEITKDEFNNLIKLKSHEIDEILKKYEFVNEKDQAFALIAFATLQNKKNKRREKLVTEHNKKIVDILLKGNNKRREKKLDIIKYDSIYWDLNLIEEFTKKISLNIGELLTLEEVIKKLEPISLDFSKKIISLTINSPTTERYHLGNFLNISEEKIKKLASKKRALEALKKQDTFEKAETIIKLSFNKQIYRNKKLFELLQNQESKEKMEALKDFYILNKENRHDLNLLREFSNLDDTTQKSIINQLNGIICDKMKSKEEEEQRKLTEYEQTTNYMIANFFNDSTETSKQAKKLIKKFNNPYFQVISKNDTKKLS